jgi:hypothetical protein
MASASTNVRDSVVDEIVSKFQERSRVGITKYGTTLDRKDLKPEDWVNHIQEELMDAILYTQRLRRELSAFDDKDKEKETETNVEKKPATEETITISKREFTNLVLIGYLTTERYREEMEKNITAIKNRNGGVNPRGYDKIDEEWERDLVGWFVGCFRYMFDTHLKEMKSLTEMPIGRFRDFIYEKFR